MRQYVGELRRHGLAMREVFSFIGAYPPAAGVLRPFWAVANLGEHLFSAAASYGSDVTFLQREFLSTYFTMERLVRKPVVLDVDDAIWIYRDGRCARSLARLSEKVICGNSFLADWFSRWNGNVEIIPTPVDTDHFQPDGRRATKERFTILWTGSSSNLPYLYDIEEALYAVLDANPKAFLRVVSNEAPRFARIPADRYDFVRWSEQGEVRLIQESDAGLMPLRDTVWERGKCSFKMLSYMACGLPVVVSNVGMNVEVLGRGTVGFGADTRDDWVGAIEQLMARPSLGESMGQSGREVVEAHYSVKVNAKRLGDAIRSVAGA